MAFPGILTWAEFATGLITRGIKINGNYLLVNDCNINQTQQIETLDNLVQGGPGNSVSNLGAKKISGSISFPVRIDDQGNFEPAFLALANHAQNPVSGIYMDTNHILSHLSITAEDIATDNNQLLRIDSLIISSFKISCAQGSDVQCEISFEGMIDTEFNSDYAVPNPDSVIGRALSWADCNIFREESSMRTTTSFDINITNTIQSPVFLIPYQTIESGIASTRSDQIQLLGFTSVKWSGSVKELIRSGADLNTFIHGGWMINENLTVQIGTMTAKFVNPLFQIANLPLTSSVLTRTTSWNALVAPNTPLYPNGLITFA